MLILSSAQVRQALPMRQAIEVMKQAFAALSDHRATVPHRIHLPVARHAGVSLFMPAWLDSPTIEQQALVVKVVSLFDGNPARGLARIQAAVVALEPDTGRPAALLEGATLTAIRTAAASGAATDLLARPEARTLALFGAGVQARAHLEAMLAVRPIEEVRIYSRSREKVDALIADWAQSGASLPRLIPADSPSQALAQADLVCATTTSREPLFADDEVPAGVHLNAVGSYTPDAAEIPAVTVRRALVVVDCREAAWGEAGDLIRPFRAGVIDRHHVHAELGELVLGQRPGRSAAGQVTLFKSVGVAVQDAAAARCALENARRLGLGTEVHL